MDKQKKDGRKNWEDVFPKITINLPDFLNSNENIQNDRIDSSKVIIYQIEEKVKQFNYSVLYSLKPDPRFRQLTREIKSKHHALKDCADFSQSMKLFRELVKLIRERHKVSGNLVAFIEYNNWSTLFQKNSFWKNCRKKSILKIEIDEMQQKWERHAEYAHYDAESLTRAACCLMDLQKYVVQQLKKFNLTIFYDSGEEEKAISDFLKDCQRQINREREKILWSMLARIELFLSKEGACTSDLIQDMVNQLVQSKVLGEHAGITHPFKKQISVKELEFFYQYIIQNGTREHIHTLASIMGAHTQNKFALCDSAQKLELLPDELAKLYFHSNESFIFRYFCQQFISERRKLFVILLFMMKIQDQVRGDCQIDVDTTWNDLIFIQQLLKRNNEKASFMQKMAIFFNKEFKKFYNESQDYFSKQKLEIADAQIVCLENLLCELENIVDDLSAYKNKLELIEKRLKVCAEYIKDNRIYSVKLRMQSLMVKFTEMKSRAEIKRKQKEIYCGVQKALEVLLKEKPLGKLEFYRLQQGMVNIPIEDRNRINQDYLSEDSFLFHFLHDYFTVLIFQVKRIGANDQDLLVEQYLALIAKYNENSASIIDKFFSNTLEKLNEYVLSKNIPLENFNCIINRLFKYFRCEHQVKRLCQLDIKYNGENLYKLKAVENSHNYDLSTVHYLQKKAGKLKSRTEKLLKRGECVSRSLSQLVDIKEDGFITRITTRFKEGNLWGLPQRVKNDGVSHEGQCNALFGPPLERSSRIVEIKSGNNLGCLRSSC